MTSLGLLEPCGLRKTLAIGADNAIRVDAEATDGFFVAKQLAKVVQDGGDDLN